MIGQGQSSGHMQAWKVLWIDLSLELEKVPTLRKFPRTAMLSCCKLARNNGNVPLTALGARSQA